MPLDESLADAAAPVLSVRGLRKAFDRVAVDGLDLTVPAGQFYALLGPNGAGKTTTLRMVAGLLAPDAGSITVGGFDLAAHPRDAKRLIAWVPDEPMVYDKLTPLEYLAFVAGLWEMRADEARPAAEQLLTLLELWPHRAERCESFSKGMKQKLALAGALIHQPRLLILDEPLTGLDAGAARLVKDVLKARAAEGCAIVLTTHILEVAERMADRIGIIRAGKMIAEGALDELRRGQGHTDGSLEDIFLGIVRSEAA